MKHSILSVAFVLIIILISVILLSGCASTGIQRSEKATSTMQTVDDDIKLIVVKLDATGASLDELTKPGQSDVKKAFDLYSENVEEMEDMQEDFSKHADKMKERGKEYFEEWQTEGSQYKNQQIQKLSEQRRMDLSEIYSGIARNSIGVKEAFRTYISDIVEIQTFLSNDLTPKGIEAVSDLTSKVINDGSRLKYEIKQVQSAIERARAEMAQQ